MKKALIVLLILAVAGGLFAQEAPTFTWTGEFVTGIHVGINEAHDDPELILANDDGNNRVRLNGAVVGPTYGFNFRLQAANVRADQGFAVDITDPTNPGITLTTNRIVTVPFAYGYVTFFDNLLKVTAGQIDPKAWNSGTLINADWSHEGAVRFEFTPSQVDGLNVGFSLKPFAFVNPKDNANRVSVADALQETEFGFKYTGLSILDLGGAFKLDGDGDTAKDMNAHLWVNLKGIPNLTTASLEFVGLNLSDLEDTGTGEIQLGQRVAYAINALTLQLSAREHIYTNENSDLALWIQPQVTYQINDSLKATLVGTIGSADTFEHIGLEIKPSLTYTVGKATIDFIYKFNSDNARPDLWKTKADTKSLQAIGVNLTLAF
jgi:hypothetical protein